MAAVCAVPVVGLLAVAGLAPLPFAVAQPGITANVLGAYKGQPVVTVSGAHLRHTSGQLRMTTIVATGPGTAVHLGDVVDSWWRADRAVMPHDAVYPGGGTTKDIERRNDAEMQQSQDSATAAALSYLGRSPKSVHVTLRLADVGGPSAGLLFSLGIVDKLAGDGSGGDLTGGRTVAGTGTITSGGSVGPVGGVALKTQAARRDGATVFLLPKEECNEAGSALPKGLRLIPVTSLKGAVQALRSLKKGGPVPTC
jgi:PDZ domain-containing protein